MDNIFLFSGIIKTRTLKMVELSENLQNNGCKLLTYNTNFLT